MCGRMFQKRSIVSLVDLIFPRDLADVLRPLLKELEDEAEDLYPNFDIRPTNHVVVFTADEGKPSARTMPWGGKPKWSQRTLFNSRDDKLDGRAWGPSFDSRRCLIPADGFFEWTGPKGSKQAHAISPSDGSPLLFAGLWRRDGGEEWCSVITTEASDWMQPLHHREPVRIEPPSIERYLMDEEPPYDLIRPSPVGAWSEFACQSPTKLGEPKPQGLF